MGVVVTHVTVYVVVKDGEEAVKCAGEKVADMFEVTSNLGDWNGVAKMSPTVSVEKGDGAMVRAEGREVLRMRSEGLQAKEALCTQPTVLAEAWQAELGSFYNETRYCATLPHGL